jgi:hypothetical protein
MHVDTATVVCVIQVLGYFILSVGYHMGFEVVKSTDVSE